jgi:hypothetical protein
MLQISQKLKSYFVVAVWIPSANYLKQGCVIKDGKVKSLYSLIAVY